MKNSPNLAAHSMEPKETEILKKIRQYLEPIPEVQFALIFGSFARNTQKAHSDVDIAIAGTIHFSADALSEFMLDLSDITGREIDLIDLETSHGSSLEEPMLKGTILFLKDYAVREKLLNRMMREHEDDQRVQNNIFQERLRIWGK